MNNKYGNRHNTEQELLLEALEVFQRQTNFNLKNNSPQALITGERGPDAKIRLKSKDTWLDFYVEIKTTINDALLGRIKHQFEELPGKWLLITRYVPGELAKKMKALHLQFIDTVGNAYIDVPPTFIFMIGNKPVQPLRMRTEGGVIGRAGLYVVFALLCCEGLEKKTYRDIAQVARVALGTVAGVWKDLLRQGFLVGIGDDVRRLVKKKELFDKWITAYAEKLRPKNLIGRYTADRPEFWRDADLIRYEAQWGGEVAAHKMTRYLKPEVVTIYMRRPVNNLVLGLKLRKNDEGNVELREQFWRFENPGNDKNIVPPLLVYADLLATADPRNVETAKIIYEEYLQRHLGKT